MPRELILLSQRGSGRSLLMEVLCETEKSGGETNGESGECTEL